MGEPTQNADYERLDIVSHVDGSATWLCHDCDWTSRGWTIAALSMRYRTHRANAHNDGSGASNG